MSWGNAAVVVTTVIACHALSWGGSFGRDLKKCWLSPVVKLPGLCWTILRLTGNRCWCCLSRRTFTSQIFQSGSCYLLPSAQAPCSAWCVTFCCPGSFLLLENSFPWHNIQRCVFSRRSCLNSFTSAHVLIQQLSLMVVQHFHCFCH